MKHYRHVLFLSFFIMCSAVCLMYAASPVTVHFFESAVCPSCERAKKFFNEYAGNNNVTVIQYEVRNKNNAVDKKNMANINKLLAMLRAIDKKVSKRPFIYDSSMKACPFYEEKGVPYYNKRISQTTVLKKPLPVPVFIIGDKVVAGFQKSLIIRFINEEKNK